MKEDKTMQTTIESKYLTVKQAAEYLKLHPGTVYSLVYQGRLRCAKAGNRLRFRAEDLERFLWGPGLRKE